MNRRGSLFVRGSHRIFPRHRAAVRAVHAAEGGVQRFVSAPQERYAAANSPLGLVLRRRLTYNETSRHMNEGRRGSAGSKGETETMTISIEEMAARFAANRTVLTKAVRWLDPYAYALGAAQLACLGLEADGARIREWDRRLKKSAGAFSVFSGSERLMAVCELAAARDPEAAMQQLLAAAEALQAELPKKKQLALLAAVLADLEPPERYAAAAARVREILDQMQGASELFRRDDFYAAMLLSLSGQRPQGILHDVLRCNKLLQEKYDFGGQLQYLCCVLALFEGSAESRCAQAAAMYKELLNKSKNYGPARNMAGLGLLAMFHTEGDDLVEDLSDMYRRLFEMKGFGTRGIGAKTHFLFAALLLLGVYQRDELLAAQHAAENAEPLSEDSAMARRLLDIQLLSVPACVHLVAAGGAPGSKPVRD